MLVEFTSSCGSRHGLGPDFVSSSVTIPSGIAIAMFASIGTWFVAKNGFARRDTGTD